MNGVMVFSPQNKNLKPQTTKIFAKDVLPGNLIVLGTNIAVILNIVKIKIDCFDWYEITFLSKSKNPNCHLRKILNLLVLNTMNHLCQKINKILNFNLLKISFS